MAEFVTVLSFWLKCLGIALELRFNVETSTSSSLGRLSLALTDGLLTLGVSVNDLASEKLLITIAF